MVPKMKKTDERLWDDFFITFQTMFKDSAAIERANYELRTITMREREVDEYINKFEDLIVLAERDRNEQGSIELFRDGLLTEIHLKIMNRSFLPQTLDQWQGFARNEIGVGLEIESWVGKNPDPKAPTRQNQTKYLSKFGSVLRTSTRKEKDPDAMDVDTIKTDDKRKPPFKKRTPKERKRHDLARKEGKCYKCFEKGHLAKDCKKRTSNTRSRKTQVDKEEASDEEKPPAYEERDLIKAIKAMSLEKKDALLERLSMEGF